MGALIGLVTGAIVGAAAHSRLMSADDAAVAQTAAGPIDVASLQAELETIKGKLPDQAHVMQDVSYHFSNLWFAGQHENWDLASFYWTETRSHLRWAVRVIPKRKDNAGREVDLGVILQAIENGPLKDLQGAIAARDRSAFEKHYRTSMESCYSCHKSSDKPFLRPQIPERPESPIVNFDPKAKWPQ
jgi:hypothetical protein